MARKAASVSFEEIAVASNHYPTTDKEWNAEHQLFRTNIENEMQRLHRLALGAMDQCRHGRTDRMFALYESLPKLLKSGFVAFMVTNFPELKEILSIDGDGHLKLRDGKKNGDVKRAVDDDGLFDKAIQDEDSLANKSARVTNNAGDQQLMDQKKLIARLKGVYNSLFGSDNSANDKLMRAGKVIDDRVIRLVDQFNKDVEELAKSKRPLIRDMTTKQRKDYEASHEEQESTANDVPDSVIEKVRGNVTSMRKAG